jgi:hypothetical protein
VASRKYDEASLFFRQPVFRVTWLKGYAPQLRADLWLSRQKSLNRFGAGAV